MPYLPILTPTDLQQRLMVGATREDHWLDFRRDPHERPEDCARDVAQFANASGGVLLVGADETGHVLNGWQTVSNADEYIRWMDDTIKGNLTPVPVVEPVTLRIHSGEMVVALNVPPSLALIARRQGDSFEFPIRSVDSRRYMTLMEVEARMGNKERAMMLRIQQIRIQRNARILLDAEVEGTDVYGWALTEVNDDVVILTLGMLSVAIPLGYIEAVHPTKDPKADWTLALSCRLYGIPSGSPNYFLVKRPILKR